MKLNFDRVILVLAIAWYSLTAYFSLGYYQADEHYQLIEFAGVIDGTAKGTDLAWEFQAQIRPSLQPVLCHAVFSACRVLSIDDAYAQAFILRLLTGLFAVFSIRFFARSCKPLILPENWKLFLVLSYFTWFLPFVNVRFSSETWAGLFLLLSLALSMRENIGSRQFFMIGLLTGLGFLFRFQAIAASAGLILWLMIIKKESFGRIALLGTGAALVIVAGTLLDLWFYKNFVFTPWRYFKVNLIDGVASGFGTSPWYYYFYYVFRFSFFPFGILILGSLLFLLIKKPANIFIWTVVPFLVLHSVIPHKELRFLFPVINLIPAIFFLAFQESGSRKFGIRENRFLYVLAILLLLVNFTGLAVSSTKPAGPGRMRITKRIHETGRGREINLISYQGSNPYDPWNKLNATFYMEPNITFRNLPDPTELDPGLIDPGKWNLLVIKKKDADHPAVKEFISAHGLRMMDRGVPECHVWFLKLYGYRTAEILELYCD